MWSPNKDTRRALDALGEQLGGYLARLERVESAPAPSAHLETLQAGADSARFDITEVQKQIRDLTLAIDEGIQRTDRAERRVRGVVQRARKELAKLGYEDPGLEAEAHELRVVDGDGGGDGGVPAVSEEVAEVEAAPSSIRGVSADQLRRRWGY